MGTHPIFESDFDCLTDIFQMRRSALREATGVSSFLGATEALRDIFEEYGSKVGDKTMMTRAKFVELCEDVSMDPRMGAPIYNNIFRYVADKDNNDLLDFQEFVTIMLDFVSIIMDRY